jgi:hypothetical protein
MSTDSEPDTAAPPGQTGDHLSPLLSPDEKSRAMADQAAGSAMRV